VAHGSALVPVSVSSMSGEVFTPTDLLIDHLYDGQEVREEEDDNDDDDEEEEEQEEQEEEEEEEEEGGGGGGGGGGGRRRGGPDIDDEGIHSCDGTKWD
jgi:hypothetical protein